VCDKATRFLPAVLFAVHPEEAERKDEFTLITTRHLYVQFKNNLSLSLNPYIFQFRTHELLREYYPDIEVEIHMFWTSVLDK
jgi:hypothetical protein